MAALHPQPQCLLCTSVGGHLIRQGTHWRVIRATDAPLPEVYRVVAQAHVREFSELPNAERAALMDEVARIEADLIARFAPDKINLASLGNRVAHLHWHIMPRFRTDPHWPDSLWSARRPATELDLGPGAAAAEGVAAGGFATGRVRLVLDGWDVLNAPASKIRTAVFVNEQGVDPADEWETADAWARHAVVWADGLPVATGRLLSMGPGEVAKLGRMAVLPGWRGRGLGRAVLQALLAEAQVLGFEQCLLHAQLGAMGFYKAAGFVPEGDVFSEAGIVHQRMRLALAR